jgi:hypothetical protein
VTSVCALRDGRLASASEAGAKAQWGQHAFQCDETLRVWHAGSEVCLAVAGVGSEGALAVLQQAPRLCRNTHHPLLAGAAGFAADAAVTASLLVGGVVVAGDFGGALHFLERVEG